MRTKNPYCLYLPDDVIRAIDNEQDFMPRSKIIELILRNFLDGNETIPDLLKKVKVIQSNV